MVVLHEIADVARPLGEVFDYVSDFTNTIEWDTTATHACKVTPGPIQVGTEFSVSCALPIGSISLGYRVLEYQQNELIVLQGQSKLFDIEDRISFRTSNRGTRIDYQATFLFKQPFSLLEKSARKGLEKMGSDSVASLARALEDYFPVAATPVQQGKPLTELPLFTRLGFTRGQKRFQPMSASVKGKHVVITGATAGLGYAAAKGLAERGATLTLIARDKAKATEAVANLKGETGTTDIHYHLADLSLMADVDALIERLLSTGHPIDILINNAGALYNSRGETAEGLEQSHALLLLSPHRLTVGLKPLLLQAQSPRVINIVSGGMYSQKLDVARLKNGIGDHYSGSAAYAREKRALMVLTEEWARIWEKEGIVVNAMHPGWADTPGLQNSLPGFRSITKYLLRSPKQGADTIIWLAASREAGDVSGKLFLDRRERSTHLSSKTRETLEDRRKLMRLLAGNIIPQDQN